MISSPGDRQDHEIKEMARIAVRNSDSIIIREDKDLRGRKPYETATMMQNAAVTEMAGSNKELYLVVNELDAYLEAWKRSKEGDQLIFLFEKFTMVDEFLSIVSSDKVNLEKEII